MTTFLEDEASSDASEPRELFDITISATTYYLTSASRDIVYLGNRYISEAINRGPTDVAQVRENGSNEIEIKLRVDHPIVRRWLAQGVPPKVATVVVWRQQVRSGLVEKIWTGNIASISVEESEGKLTVTCLLGESFRRRLPTITVGTQCSHVLYGSGCNVSRAGSNVAAITYLCTTTVIYVNGRDVRVDLSNVPANYLLRSTWLQFGELKHVASGERMTIAEQVDPNPGISTVTQVTMQLQIVGMNVGDSVELYAGCAHEVITCQQKFNANQVNYGGFPALPTKNPFFPTGLGVMEQV